MVKKLTLGQKPHLAQCFCNLRNQRQDTGPELPAKVESALLLIGGAWQGIFWGGITAGDPDGSLSGWQVRKGSATRLIWQAELPQVAPRDIQGCSAMQCSRKSLHQALREAMTDTDNGGQPWAQRDFPFTGKWNPFTGSSQHCSGIRARQSEHCDSLEGFCHP